MKEADVKLIPGLQMPPTRLGFGVSGVHAMPWLLPRSKSVALIRRAVELGLTVLDTAPSYGAGETERRVGEALLGLTRENVWLSTKAGVSGGALTGRRRDFSPAGVETSIRASLKRLGVEGVDCVFLHGVSGQELTRPLIRRLDDLRSSGAFNSLGAAGRGAELDAAIRTGKVAYLMTPVHASITPAAQERLAAARRAGLKILAIEISGGRAPRRRWPRKLTDVHAFARRLRASDAPGGGPAYEALLSAAVADKRVDCVLTTTSQLEHLERNAALLKDLPP